MLLASRSIRMVTLGVVVALSLWSTASGDAKFTEHKVSADFEDRRTLTKLRQQKQAALKGGDQAALERYFKQFFFPSMSLSKNHGKLADMRVELQKDLQRANRGPAYELVRDLAYRYAGRYAFSEQYHPAVRYNAMLIFGTLNQSEADLRSGRPAEPFGKTLRPLLQKGISDADPTVRFAALLGLCRHAELQGQPGAPKPWSPQIRDGVAKYLSKTLETSEPTNGLDREVHDWMRRIAAEAIGFAKPTPTDAVIKGLTGVMADKQADAMLRCQCADSLGRLELEKSKASAEQLTQFVALVAADCCRYEIRELTELASSSGRRSIGRGRPFQQGLGRMDNDDNELEVTDETTLPSRRRLLERLTLLHRSLQGDEKLGIRGIAGMSDGKAAIAQVLNNVKTMIVAIQRTEDELLTYGGRLRNEYLELKDLLPTNEAEALDEPEPIEEATPVAEQEEATPEEDNVAAGS